MDYAWGGLFLCLAGLVFLVGYLVFRWEHSRADGYPGEVWSDRERLSYGLESGTQTILWRDVELFGIRTTDEGPLIEDVFAVFVNREDEVILVVPQEAQGFSSLVEEVSAFPGFRADEFRRAIGCTSNRWFECWNRENGSIQFEDGLDDSD